jgi:hypothetical protein
MRFVPREKLREYLPYSVREFKEIEEWLQRFRDKVKPKLTYESKMNLAKLQDILKFELTDKMEESNGITNPADGPKS